MVNESSSGNPPIYLVPHNITEFIHAIQSVGYARAEFFNPNQHCTFPNMLKMGPEDIVVCLFYFFGVGGVAAAAIYLYWQQRRQRHRSDNGQSTDRQIPL